MRLKLILFVVLSLTIIVLINSDRGWTQPATGFIAKIELLLREPQHLVNGWERKANIALFLIILVGSLGLVAGALQAVKKQWSKSATAVIALSISLITFINQTMNEADHREFRKIARKGQANLSLIRSYALQYENATEENRDFLFEKIRALLKEIYQLEENLKKSQMASLQFVPALYAQASFQKERPPQWIYRPPVEKNSIYFVGLGESSDLKKSKEYSFQDAVDKAVDYFVFQFEKNMNQQNQNFDLELLSQYLVESAREQATYFEMNKTKNLYRYYTLLKFNKEFARVDLELFALKRQLKIPGEINEAIRKSQPTRDSYFEQRNTVYNNILEESRESLPVKDYELFLEARQLRKNGQYNKAIETLKGIVERYPEFYFGWYNLGLAYDAVDNFDAARHAYEKAVQLEPVLSVRDASIYNTYGYFLYRHSRYEEAKIHLKKALEIDPNHPKARGTLKAIESQR